MTKATWLAPTESESAGRARDLEWTIPNTSLLLSGSLVQLVNQLPLAWLFGCSMGMPQALDNFTRRGSMTRCQNETHYVLSPKRNASSSLASAAPTAHVARTKALVAVADGMSCTPILDLIDSLNGFREPAPNMVLKLDEQPLGEGLIQHPVGDS